MKARTEKDIKYLFDAIEILKAKRTELLSHKETRKSVGPGSYKQQRENEYIFLSDSFSRHASILTEAITSMDSVADNPKAYRRLIVGWIEEMKLEGLSPLPIIEIWNDRFDFCEKVKMIEIRMREMRKVCTNRNKHFSERAGTNSTEQRYHDILARARAAEEKIRWTWKIRSGDPRTMYKAKKDLIEAHRLMVMAWHLTGEDFDSVKDIEERILQL